MPRSVHITVPPELREALLSRLDAADGIVGIPVQPGASRRPAGDLVTVCGTDAGVVAIDEPVGLVSSSRRRMPDEDTSEASRAEMDTLLRRDADPSHDVAALMIDALDGPPGSAACEALADGRR